MKDFIYKNPVKIIFGKNSLDRAKEELKNVKNVALIYGVRSIKENGIYEKVLYLLKQENINVYEFGGITPNPKFEECVDIARQIKNIKIDLLLAVGGGSVIDATKLISILNFFNSYNEALDFLYGKSISPTGNIPLGVILTSPGTGSESNNSFVITVNDEKLIGINNYTFPKFSVLHPEFVKTLPRKQLINGLIDTYVHILEQYVTYNHGFFVQDRKAEALLKSMLFIINNWQKKDFKYDYNLAYNFLWVSTQALNFSLSRGVPSDWSTHNISHYVTTLYNIDHARALALVLFKVWRYKFSQKLEKLYMYGKNVLDINCKNKEELAKNAINFTEKLFNSIGVKTEFSDYGLNTEEVAKNISNKFENLKIGLGENQDIFKEDIFKILTWR